MRKLIRAEMYRLLHSGSYARCMLLVVLVMAVVPLLIDFSLLDKSLAENMETFLLSDNMLIFYVPYVSVFFVTAGYMKKTAYYEVMAGNKIGHMIGSKLLVDGIGIGLVCFVFATALSVVVAVKNGTGGVTGLPLRALLFLVICLHATVLSVLIGLSVKHFAACAVLFVRIQILDLLPAIMLPLLGEKINMSKETSERIMRCTLSQQISDVFRADISTELVVITVLSFVIEAMLWYGLVYFTMKKRWYK